ncbi:hypothetical protein ACFY2M_39655 [Streptomyces sp. NPDC001276]
MLSQRLVVEDSTPVLHVVTQGQKPQFSWTEVDVLNWSAKKPYDF